MDAKLARRAAIGGLMIALCLSLSTARGTEEATPIPQAGATATPAPAIVAAPQPEAVSPLAGFSPDSALEPPDSAEAERPAPKAPPAPVGPVRAAAAILRVLDKVSAETMAFEAPVGRRVRYRTLVFEVKACETLDPGGAQPRPSAYLVITSDAGAASGGGLAPRQIFRGWMFAADPGVHAVKHPVYDAWLIACSAAAPPT